MNDQDSSTADRGSELTDLLGSIALSGAEGRQQWIKMRRLEIAATLAEWKRAYIVDGIERAFADRVTIEAEDAKLALEARQIGAAVEAAKVIRRKRERAALVEQLLALLRARGMDDLIAEAERLASEANASTAA